MVNHISRVTIRGKKSGKSGPIREEGGWIKLFENLPLKFTGIALFRRPRKRKGRPAAQY